MPYVDFGYTGWWRRGALLVIPAVWFGMAATYGAWPFPKAEGESLLTLGWSLAYIAAAFWGSWALLRTVTSHAFLDGVGFLLVKGSTVQRVPWDDIAGATQTGGDSRRARVLTRTARWVDVDEFVSPAGRQQRRLIDAVTACVARPEARPTGEAFPRTFPVVWVAAGLAAAWAVMLASAARR